MPDERYAREIDMVTLTVDAKQHEPKVSEWTGGTKNESTTTCGNRQEKRRPYGAGDVGGVALLTLVGATIARGNICQQEQSAVAEPQDFFTSPAIRF